MFYNWNLEYGFLDSDYLKEEYQDPIHAYKEGFYGTEENVSHPSYFPSYLSVPNYIELN